MFWLTNTSLFYKKSNTKVTNMFLYIIDTWMSCSHHLWGNFWVDIWSLEFHSEQDGLSTRGQLLVRLSSWLKDTHLFVWRERCLPHRDISAITLLIKDVSLSYVSLYDTLSDSVSRRLLQSRFLMNNLVHFLTFSFSLSARGFEYRCIFISGVFWVNACW